MKIVHISTYDRIGGAARAAFELHMGLMELGIDSSMLVRNRTSDVPSTELFDIQRSDAFPAANRLSEIVRERYINCNRTDISNTVFSLPYPGSDVASHPAVQDADVINLHWVADYLSPASISDLIALKKPVVWTLHDQWAMTGGCHFSSSCSGFRKQCRNCKQLSSDSLHLPAAVLNEKQRLWDSSRISIVTPSRWLSRQASCSTLFRESDIRTIPYSVDTGAFRPVAVDKARKQFNIPGSSACILFAAYSIEEKRKGFDDLRSALELLSKNRATARRLRKLKLRLLCMGTGSHPDISGITVQHLGNLETDRQVSAAYSAADITVIPSEQDNLPNTMLESMSCRTPVLAYRTGGITDVIRNNRNGFLVPRKNIEALADSILTVLEDREKLEQAAANACHTIRTGFHLTRQAEEYLSLYENLITNHETSTAPIRLKGNAGADSAVSPHLKSFFDSFSRLHGVQEATDSSLLRNIPEYEPSRNHCLVHQELEYCSTALSEAIELDYGSRASRTDSPKNWLNAINSASSAEYSSAVLGPFALGAAEQTDKRAMNTTVLSNPVSRLLRAYKEKKAFSPGITLAEAAAQMEPNHMTGVLGNGSLEKAKQRLSNCMQFTTDNHIELLVHEIHEFTGRKLNPSAERKLRPKLSENEERTVAAYLHANSLDMQLYNWAEAECDRVIEHRALMRKPSQFDTPVLMVVYNRADITSRVIMALRKVRPTKLFVAADAYRPHVKGDKEACAEVVRLFDELIDWPCELKMLKRKKNVGCRAAESGAIDWFFKHVKEGIILEDDSLASPSFFWYCRELLEKYRDNPQVMHISGNNFQMGFSRTSKSYYFSRFNHIWGWATWRSAWKHYDVDMKKWNKLRNTDWLETILQDDRAVSYWRSIFDRAASGELNTWDFQWTFACWLNNGLSILPDVNLVSNIGFMPNATNNTDWICHQSDLPPVNIPLPLKHPSGITRNHSADIFTQEYIFETSISELPESSSALTTRLKKKSDKSSSNEDATRPTAFIFNHLAKCAGVTFRNILHEKFGKGYFDCYSTADWFHVKDRTSRRRKSDIALCGHTVWGIHEMFADNFNPRYMTLLREPLERMLSEYRFHRFWHSPATSFTEYLASCQHNYMTQLLGNGDIDTAKERLMNYALIGTTEGFDEFLEMFASLAGLGSINYTEQNKTRQASKFDDDKIVETFRHFNALDHELYRWVKKEARTRYDKFLKHRNKDDVSIERRIVAKSFNNRTSPIRSLLDSGDYINAIRLMERERNKNPNQLAIIGEYYKRIGRPDKAKRKYELAARGDIEKSYQLADLWLAEKPEKALGIITPLFSRYSDLNTKTPDSAANRFLQKLAFLMANAYENSFKSDTAASLRRMAKAINPDEKIQKSWSETGGEDNILNFVRAARGKKSIIMGAGVSGFRTHLFLDQSDLVAFADDNFEMQGRAAMGRPVIAPSEINSHNYDMVMVANLNCSKQIKNKLTNEHDVPADKIHIVHKDVITNDLVTREAYETEKDVCIFYTTCIGEPIDSILGKSGLFHDRYRTFKFWNFRKDVVPESLLKRCSLFIYQDLSESWGPYAASEYMKRLPRKCQTICIPKINMYAIWPFSTVDPRTHPEKDYPYGRHPYGDSFVLDLLSKGMDRKRILDRIKDINLGDHVDLDAIMEYDMKYLSSEHNSRDMDIWSFIEKNYKTRKLFHTYNHPSEELTRWIANLILKGLGMNQVPKNKIRNMQLLDVVNMPIYASVIDALGLKYVDENSKYNIFGKDMTFTEYYEHYIDYT